MPPKVKFQKEEIIRTALQVARAKGIDAVTAREVAAALQVSPRPIFTYYDTMDQLRRDVYVLAKEQFRTYVEQGLRFAQQEPELYRLLFLTRPGEVSGGAMQSMRYLQELVRDSVMRIYGMDAVTADCYSRDLWLVAFSFATLIVTDDCPYSFDEMIDVGSEISLSVCKAYKEIPGLPQGSIDKEAIFRELVRR